MKICVFTLTEMYMMRKGLQTVVQETANVSKKKKLQKMNEFDEDNALEYIYKEDAEEKRFSKSIKCFLLE